ncbi:hypothetical protein M378DRAFT_156564 [Amanita muscaria Koide BX008]|uniref:Uncharacterized protein n=1 Tax=Amanita muscaria (strain Koide BX008) TaxID=946122 RepID=A0A0C2XMR8_AMAMK|nr:hypothetical protein M378DRAFT_156564 [Amanita muscaria Koide BX008]
MSSGNWENGASEPASPARPFAYYSPLTLHTPPNIWKSRPESESVDVHLEMDAEESIGCVDDNRDALTPSDQSFTNVLRHCPRFRHRETASLASPCSQPFHVHHCYRHHQQHSTTVHPH